MLNLEKMKGYVNQFQEGNEYGLYFIDNQLKDCLEKNEFNQTEIEHILDYLYSEKKIFTKIGYKTIKQKADKWNKKLQEIGIKDNEKEGIDYEIVKDFGDGFKFVKLISKESYEREGKLMSHCVASYYGRNINIYSLRDNKNIPHCTIEENNQVKGKGNQTVDNKYFGYCIKFLEEIGMSIGENEMRNIGYYKLDTIDKGLQVEDKYLYDGKYISDKNLNKIKDKDGEQYNGFGLLKIKPLFEFKKEMSVKFNFDISVLRKYFISKFKRLDRSKLAGGYRSQLAGGYRSILAGGDESKLAGGNRSILAGGDDNQLVGGDENKLAGGNRSILAGGDDNQLVGGDESKLAGGYRSQLAGGYRSQLVGGDRCQLAGGNGSILAGGDDNQLVGGDRSQLAGGNRSILAGGDESKLALNGKNSIAVGGVGSIGKGVIGSYIVLCEKDEDFNICNVQVLKIDGKKYKENVFYKLENGEFIEYNN